jgi:hypothetical protein
MSKSIQERLKRLEYLYRCLCNSSGGGSQTLAQTLVFGKETGGENILVNNADAIELENTSLLKKGTYDFGGNGGISRICSNNYEDMWQNGFRHVFDQSGFIRNSTNCFNIVPNNSFDDTLKFAVGSFWTLDDGTTYKCIDNTTGAAVWELYSSPPKYKVYTALLAQSGGNNPTAVTDLPLVPGLSYQIIDNDGGTADFTNVGAPNNDPGTFFSATGTTPTSWGNNTLGVLEFNTGAPTTIVLENTLGNISFEYRGPGSYRCYSNNLFTIDKTTVFISDTLNKNTPTDRLQLRVLCSTNAAAQPGFLEIFTGTTSSSYEDDIIDPGTYQYPVAFEIRVYNKY